MTRVGGPAIIVALVASCGAPARAPTRAPELVPPDRTPIGAIAPKPEATKIAPAAPQPQPSEHAVRLASGLVIETLIPGRGAPPVKNDRITLRHAPWLSDRTAMTDRAQDYTGPLGVLSTELAEAVQHMAAGETARLWIPTVDTRDRDAAPLVLDLELRGIELAPPVPADVAAPPTTAVRWKSGIAALVVVPNNGTRHPTPRDTVDVSYSVWSAEGTLIETTMWGGQPGRQSWRVRDRGKALEEALGSMVIGQRSVFWIPVKLLDVYTQYPDEVHTYEIKLLDITSPPQEPTTPKDVARPPRSARRTALGVSYRFLRRGTSQLHPRASDQVRVHYSGWTTDGRLFDSSEQRGTPPVFPLAGVIPGWTDVVQKMAQGDRIRAWIPEHLAYKGQAGRPQGMLVFDIELIEIVP